MLQSPCAKGLMIPNLEGAGNSIIRMLDDGQDVFFGDKVRDWRFTRLQLIGGRNQLHIGNSNLQNGLVVIAQSGFYYSKSAAIRLMEPNETTGFRGSFSTQFVVRECKIISCDQALVNWADWTSMQDCTIETSINMTGKAVLENHDRLYMNNIFASPRNDPSRVRRCGLDLSATGLLIHLLRFCCSPGANPEAGGRTPDRRTSAG